MSRGPIRNIKGQEYSPYFDALPQIPLLGQTEILAVRDGGLVDCMVPAELIDYEEVPVKEEWASALAEQMREKAARIGGTGQETPIQVGYIEGEGLFKIKDGFHRDAALRLLGIDQIYSTASLTTWNDLYDDRIFTAKDHAHVRFSRVVQWIREVWAHSGLSDEMTVEQAVLLYRYGNDGSKLHLNPHSVAAAKGWVQRKEHQWGMAAMTFHGYLKVAENVDPQIIHSTREKRSGRRLEAPTQAIAKMLSDELPGQDNFGLQNLVVAAAIANNLKSSEVKALCIGIQGMDVESAEAFINDIDWDTWEPAFGDTKSKQLRRAYDPRHKGAAVLGGALADVDRITQRVRLSFEREEETTPEMQVNIKATLQRIQELYSNLGTLATELGRLRIADQPRTTLTPNTNASSTATELGVSTEAHQAAQANDEEDRQDTPQLPLPEKTSKTAEQKPLGKVITIPGTLSARDRNMLELAAQGLTNEEIAAQLYLTPKTLGTYLVSAYKKIGVNNKKEAILWTRQEILEVDESEKEDTSEASPNGTVGEWSEGDGFDTMDMKEYKRFDGLQEKADMDHRADIISREVMEALKSLQKRGILDRLGRSPTGSIRVSNQALLNKLAGAGYVSQYVAASGAIDLPGLLALEVCKNPNARAILWGAEESREIARAVLADTEQYKEAVIN